MNYKTNWWGITMYAETEDDKAVLHALNESLKNKEPLDDYEGGEIELIDNKLIIHR